MPNRKKVAVIFGGTSIEHDVSVLTGLQIIQAIDTSAYEPFPIYISPEGNWYASDALLNRRNYLLKAETKKILTEINPRVAKNNLNHHGQLVFEPLNKSLFKRPEMIIADIVIPALHGGQGENGALQGLFETIQVPYLGAGILCSAVCMDKNFSKHVFSSLNIPTVPGTVINSPEDGICKDTNALHDIITQFGSSLCVKPAHLGSSVGVSKVENVDELQTALNLVFQIDTQAIVEQYIPNLVEYNVAVSKAFGRVQTSAIERPLRSKDLLNFEDKYLSSGGLDSKLACSASNELMSSNRVFNPPELTTEQAQQIRTWACQAFSAVQASGSVRLDFLCNSETHEFYLNEINTLPGSFAYYLWEASEQHLTFTDLLTLLLKEAEQDYRFQVRNIDPRVGHSTIFRRD